MNTEQILKASSELAPKQRIVWLSSHARKSERRYGELWRALAKAEKHEGKLRRTIDVQKKYGPRLSFRDAEEILRRHEAGEKHEAIAVDYGITASGVSKAAKKAMMRRQGWYSIREAAELFGVTQGTVMRFIAVNKIKTMQHYKARLVRLADLEGLK